MTIFKKEQSSNEKAVVLVDYEMKVTELVGWVIDAPVENNPERSPCGKGAKRQGSQQSPWE